VIVVIGSMNFDRIARLRRVPEAGETLAIESLATAPGGKGGNVAAAAARLGARVAMVGRVGQDHEGEELRAALRSAGVDLRAVETADGVATGTAWIWLAADGENRIGVFAGANRTLTPDVLDAVAAGPARPFAPGRLVVLNLEIPLATVEAAVARARRAGARVLLNLSPVGGLRPSILGSCDVLVVNGQEAAQIASESVPEDRQAAARLAAKLREEGPGTVVVTLGALGAAAAHAAGTTEVAAVPVAAVDTTGAGDAFLGALAAALEGGASLELALGAAAAAGAFTATRLGAQSGQPTATELRAFAARHGLSLPALGSAADHREDGGEAPRGREG
jgi:ribokinase